MKKLQRILVIAIVSILCPHTGQAGILPNDLPTIEALIDQHKECMSAEDESNRQLAANASIKAMVKDVAQKYDDVKSILDKKSNEPYQQRPNGVELHQRAGVPRVHQRFEIVCHSPIVLDGYGLQHIVSEKAGSNGRLRGVLVVVWHHKPPTESQDTDAGYQEQG